MILFACPACRTNLEADLEFAGEVIGCPSCQADVVVPAGAIARGTLVGGYSIERHLGGGGMGEVYEATQLSVGRRVALKILPPALARHTNFTSSFLHEARKLARIDLAGVVSVIDVGQESDCFYLATTLVQGEDLASRLERAGRLPEAEAVHLALEIANILRACWERYQVAHLDLKPSNIMIEMDGHVRLLDLGLSGHLLAGGEDLSFARGLILSPYMSPEQAHGATELDFRSDLYSLGATLYHLVTGRRPYPETTAEELAARVEAHPFPSVREVNPEITPAMEQAILDLTSKNPAGRPPSWDAAVELFEGIESTRTAPPPKAPSGAPRKVSIKLAKSTHPGSPVHGPGHAPPKPSPHKPPRVERPSVLPLVLTIVIAIVAAGIYFWRSSQKYRSGAAGTVPPALEQAADAGQGAELRERAASYVAAARHFIEAYPADIAGGRSHIKAAREQLAGVAGVEPLAAELATLESRIAENEKLPAAPAAPKEPKAPAPAVAAIEDHAKDPAEEEKKPAAPKKSDPLTQAAAKLLERDYEGSKALLASIEGPDTGKLKEELPTFENWVDAVYEGLRGVIGHEEILRFRDGPRSLVVKSIAPPLVRAEKVARDGERVVGRSATTFRLEDLATDELIKRINGGAGGAQAVMCGLLAYRGGQLSDARAWFNRSSSPWGPPLVRAMDESIAPTI